MKNYFSFFIGFVLTIVGVFLILHFWDDVVVLFRGCVGIVLALAGLLTLYSVKELNKKNK